MNKLGNFYENYENNCQRLYTHLLLLQRKNPIEFIKKLPHTTKCDSYLNLNKYREYYEKLLGPKIINDLSNTTYKIKYTFLIRKCINNQNMSDIFKIFNSLSFYNKMLYFKGRFLNNSNLIYELDTNYKTKKECNQLYYKLLLLQKKGDIGFMLNLLKTKYCDHVVDLKKIRHKLDIDIINRIEKEQTTYSDEILINRFISNEYFTTREVLYNHLSFYNKLKYKFLYI